MIQVIPVIYVKDGKAVLPNSNRGLEGTVLSETAKDLGSKFLDAGLNSIFVIDIDGLANGAPKNLATLESISSLGSLDITFGGGINTHDDVHTAFEHGANKITASSIAVKKSDVFSSWLISFGRRKIVLSADVIDGNIARMGDKNPTDKNVFDFIEYFYLRGILYVKCSDITGSQTNSLAALNLFKEIKITFPEIELIAGGGVKSIQDLENLRQAGVSSALVGKAFYDGSIDLLTFGRQIQTAV